MSAIALPAKDASEPEVVRVGRHTIWAASVGVLCLALIAFGGWILESHWSDPRAWMAGSLVIVGCSWCVWLMMLRLRSGYSTYIGPDGLTIPGPTYKPKLISWDDIEAITSFRIRYNGYTGIKLKTYARLIPQYSNEEVKILLRRNRWMGRGLAVAGPMSMNQSGMGELAEATRDCDSLAEYFANQRRACGCDVYFIGIDRDRNADDFAAYLEGFRAKYSHTSGPSLTRESVHA